MSGVLPVIISYPERSCCPRRIKCINQAWCSRPKHHRRLGTFLHPILFHHLHFNSRMATSTCCSWLCRYGLAYVMLIPKPCVSRWKSVCHPTNAKAMSTLRLAGIPTSLVNRRNDSVESWSPFEAVGYTATKLPFEIMIAPVCPCIDLHLDSI